MEHLSRQLIASVPADYNILQTRPVADDLIEAMVKEFRLADVRERTTSSAMLSLAARAVLLSYARDASVRAVRERSPELVMHGLAALALGDGKPDTRDSILAVAMLFRSSQILGMESGPVFEETSKLVSDPLLKTEMGTFPQRPKDSRDLKTAFFTAEKMTKDGFTYEWQPWRFAQGVKRARIKLWLQRVFGGA